MYLSNYLIKGKSYLYIRKINHKTDFVFKIEKDNTIFNVYAIRGSLLEKRFEVIGELTTDLKYKSLLDCIDSICFKYIIDNIGSIENDNRLIIERRYKNKKYE